MAVVTGAAGGLGRALIEVLTATGHDVVATDLAGADRGLDVSDAGACRALADEVRPAVWVNNAGVLEAGDAATQSDAAVERMVAVNLLGVIYGTRAAVASMRMRDGGGHVVNVASLAAWVPVPGETVYAATKAGVLSFTLGLAAELRASGVRSVRLTVVCPDGMMTPMVEPRMDDPALALTFSGLRLVEPREVAEAVADVLRRPRLVRSVPRWRGAQVRALSSVADAALPLHPLLARLGRRNQRREVRRRRTSGSSSPSG